jgi:hypothetical protein
MNAINKKEPAPWIKDVKKMTRSSVALAVIGVIVIITYDWKHSAIALMAALASLGVGCSLGFLFGIPKTVRGDSSVKSNSSADTGSSAKLQDNTNLEEISDWLTKILVGATLVQFNNLKTALRHLAQMLATGMQDPTAEPFALFLFIYFGIVGFLAGYLYTRLYLPGALSRAAKVELEKVQDQLEQITNMLDSDPNKGKFGGKSSTNDRKLSALVEQDPRSDEHFIIRAEVVSINPDRPLNAPVLFHLHPSFKPSTLKVEPKDNSARLEKSSWGAFTIGVEVPGEETRLELDLSELPGAPAKFKAR